MDEKRIIEVRQHEWRELQSENERLEAELERVREAIKELTVRDPATDEAYAVNVAMAHILRRIESGGE